ncbi:MAG: TIGR02147 family protein [Bdellovibrionota bacterium]
MDNSVNIFEFSDYRAYLSRWLAAAKRAKTSNLSRLAEAAKVHPTYLSHVLRGDKQLSLEQAVLLSGCFAHTRLEREYFLTLLLLDRAGTESLRKCWLERKEALEKEKNRLSQRFTKHRELTTEQRAIFYSNWIYSALWVSTAINDGQTLPQLAARFRLSRGRAEEMLSFLVATGVCYQEGDRFRMGPTHVHVANESPFVTKHHSNWRMKAIQRMDDREPDELFFTAPISISRADFAVIREKLNVAIKEAVEVAKESPAEDLFCLNIDFFRSGPSGP